MRLFTKALFFALSCLLVFILFITRDGQRTTPFGEGKIILDSGSYEAFKLPEYASKMIDPEYKSYFIEVEPGLKVHILEKGEGYPIFLMHGNPTSGFLYRKVVNQLPLNKVRVIMPTSIGLGFSSKVPASEHTLDNHIRWINTVLNKLQLTELVYSGQDWGGPIGMGALSLSPEILKGAVLLNTGFNAPTLNIDLSPAHATVKNPVIGELIVEVLFSIFDRLGGVQGDPDSWTSDLAKLYGEPLYESGNSKAPLAMMRMVTDGPDHPSAPAMRKIQKFVESLDIPAEIVWGMKDPILGKALQTMKDNFPNADVTETTSGHFLQEESPEEIAKAIMRIVNRVEENKT